MNTAMNFCEHTRTTKRFRCKAEIVLFPQWSRGDTARGYGNAREANPHPAGTHAHFSWDCGWLDRDADLAQQQAAA